MTPQDQSRQGTSSSTSLQGARPGAQSVYVELTARHQKMAAAPQDPELGLGKSFEPSKFEKSIYDSWLTNGCFEASDECNPGQKAFSIMIPPPNVTGALHMGHALTNTIQDILVRWHRMKGDNTLWLPGTDHAGIATQAQVEKAIAKEGKGPGGKPLTRHDLGREAFLKRVWQWKEEHGGVITRQLQRLGSSLDWKRERFTMDEGLSSAVREVFVSLYEKGLIYRGERIINWCPRCQTALSDLEVVPTDRKGHFWHLKYQVTHADGKPFQDENGEDLFLTIATTRPETLLGDTAVAVHPDDERYLKLKDKKVKLPLVGKLIPILHDDYVDREFGSGALKITPAHDFNDYELGRKHQLPFVQVMGKDGRMTAEAGSYAGLKYAEAREKILEDLKAQGLLVKVEDHANKVGLCQRCENVAEPMISKQWFVKIQPLADPAIEAVKSGKIVFSPQNWEKTYFEWMNNIRDWCISRQLWWGHQIPAWYCSTCEGITVSRQDPVQCSACKGPRSGLKRDEDVLDTWFSSALWPFSTLGWPEKTKALQTFYPTSILETGFDIIFFWVARMIMMGIHFMGDVPFRKVYLHAMVRDEKGEKMSKSKGNVIDPLVLIDQHGADPLRFTLAAMAGQGRDIKLSVDRVEGYRAFCNKLWNAVKFFHIQFSEQRIRPPQGSGPGAPGTANFSEFFDGKGGDLAPALWLEKNRDVLLAPNRWILSRLQETATRVERGFESFELNESATAIYEFAWHEFCDWYIEFSKVLLSQPNQPDLTSAEIRKQTLFTMQVVIETLLRLAHPIMPFVTEELWQSLPWKSAGSTPARARSGQLPLMTLMFQPFPVAVPGLVSVETEGVIQGLKNFVQAIRNFRGENNLSPKVEFAVEVLGSRKVDEEFVSKYASELKTLSRVSEIRWVSASEVQAREGKSATRKAVIPLAHPAVEIRIPLDGLVDSDEEVKRLQKEMDKVQSDLDHVSRKLSQATFLERAPEALVNQERAKQAEYQAKLETLQLAVARISQTKQGS